ncbi:glycosyltransferase [Mammaliicoccus sciuri]|uniref:glycosyltransferase n=1 Tax=Mammaliicoccus sciuri TaxID=1296 RepID=UPI0017854718|nr:glycosyltransferase [Mammaliicoccus sciuri]
MFKDQILYSKQEFVAYFMKCLHLTSKDIVIVDRSKGMGQPVIQNKGDSKLGVVIHAEHYSSNFTNDDYILWNNYYEYVFSHVNEVNFYIAATDRQKAVLSHQFNQYYGNLPKIYTVPVGSIHDVIKPDNRKPYSVITASRLASEKHIDWLVKAVVKAKQSIPDLIFDIYGEGAERNMLQKLIEENEANHYIKLLGHMKLQDVYANYELFFAGSTSEGFGLTLMEAIGSGLGMIGFDVDYGNTTFIGHNENGYLIPIDKSYQSEQEIVDNLAEAVIQFFKNDTSSFHEKSYERAEHFKTDNIKQKWFHLIEEVLHD